MIAFTRQEVGYKILYMAGPFLAPIRLGLFAGADMKIIDGNQVNIPSKSLLLSLGVSPEEVELIHVVSRQKTHDKQLLKEQLMSELAEWIKQHDLKQAEAAEVLMVSRPRVSDVVNRKIDKFTIDTLVDMLNRVGKPVRLAIGSPALRND